MIPGLEMNRRSLSNDMPFLCRTGKPVSFLASSVVNTAKNIKIDWPQSHTSCAVQSQKDMGKATLVGLRAEEMSTTRGIDRGELFEPTYCCGSRRTIPSPRVRSSICPAALLVRDTRWIWIAFSMPDPSLITGVYLGKNTPA